MVSTVTIYRDAGIIKIDDVSFCPRHFSDLRIEGGHPNGPVFCSGVAKAVISVTDASLLVAAGVIDNRQDRPQSERG